MVRVRPLSSLWFACSIFLPVCSVVQTIWWPSDSDHVVPILSSVMLLLAACKQGSNAMAVGHGGFSFREFHSSLWIRRYLAWTMTAGQLAGCAARGSAGAHRCTVAATAAALRSPPYPPSPCTSENEKIQRSKIQQKRLSKFRTQH